MTASGDGEFDGGRPLLPVEQLDLRATPEGLRGVAAVALTG